MSKYISLLLFIGLTLSQNTIIAVFDFENNGLEDYQVRQITRRIESQLIKHKGIDVVERNKIDDILKEQKLQMSGIVDEEKYLVELGKMLGANQVVMGSIGKITDDYFTITAKLTDIETGKMINSVDYDSENGIIDIFKGISGLPIPIKYCLNTLAELKIITPRITIQNDFTNGKNSLPYKISTAG